MSECENRQENDKHLKLVTFCSSCGKKLTHQLVLQIPRVGSIPLQLPTNRQSYVTVSDTGKFQQIHCNGNLTSNLIVGDILTCGDVG